MNRSETLRSIANSFRKLALDADGELGAQLIAVAEEYDRMAGQPRSELRLAPCPWGNGKGRDRNGPDQLHGVRAS